MYNFIFDIDDTVYDQIVPFRQAFERNFARYTHLPLDELYRQNRRFSDAIFEQQQRGEISLEDMHVYRITEAFRVMGIEIPREEALAFQRDYAAAQHEIVLTPDMQEALDYCRVRGLKIGVITNGAGDHQRGKVERLGIYDWMPREAVFVSGEVGFAKPDVRIFRRAEEMLGLDPAHTYYVGDSYANDIVGAAAAGWKSIWIHRRGAQIPEGGVQPDLTLGEGDSIAAAIRELCE
ncbi:hydrolase [Saccharibacillus sp. O16]|nr:hydrolase [Saccharibacillus sp. O16]